MRKKLPLPWILKRIRRRIPALILLVLFNAAGAVLGVLFALGTRNVIDTAVSGEKSQFYTACMWQGGIILGMLLCRFLARHLSDRLRADLDRDWKKDLLQGLLRGEYAAVSQYHSGELINRLTNDVRIVDEGLIHAFPNVIAMLLRLITAFAVLVSLEPKFALILCGIGLVVLAFTAVLRNQIKQLHKKVSQHDGIVASFFQETLEKLLIVQAMDVAPEMQRRADAILETRYQMQRKRKNVSLFANTGVHILSLGAGFVALVWCGAGLLAGTMTFGSLTAVTQLVSQLQSPFTSLSAVIPQYIAMVASAERLMELEQIPAEAPAGERDPKALYEKMDCLQAEGLCFAYDRDAVLQNVNFTLPKGSFVAVTGPSGVGKSTLLKLLLGIYRQEQGSICLHCEAETVTVDRSTRGLFAYVPQGNLLLSGTLRDNLLVANPDATETQIRQALYVSAMEEYLPQLPKGLETQLGESGAGISEGQAQRLAIARAILSGAPILLLDECTSALDPETEQLVLSRIRQLASHTCIAVSHRPAAVGLCDYQLDVTGDQVVLKQTAN